MLDLVESFAHINEHHAGMQVLVCGFVKLIHSQQDCVLCGVVGSVSELLGRKEVMFGKAAVTHEKLAPLLRRRKAELPQPLWRATRCSGHTYM